MEAARGKILQSNNTTRGFTVFGFAPALGVLEVDVQPQQGITVLPTTAGTLTVSSTDPNDTFGGSGLEAILISGVDGAYGNGGLGVTLPYYEEVLMMDGTTPVEASIDMLRVTFVQVLLGSIAGVITVAIDGVTQIVMGVGDGVSTSMRTTVPQGWSGWTEGFSHFWNAPNAVIFEFTLAIGDTTLAGITAAANQHNTFSYSGPFPILPTFDLTVRARRESGGGTDGLGGIVPIHLEKL